MSQLIDEIRATLTLLPGGTFDTRSCVYDDINSTEAYDVTDCCLHQGKSVTQKAHRYAERMHNFWVSISGSGSMMIDELSN